MKIVHKTLDNDRIANCLAIIRKDVGESFDADKLIIYIDGNQVIFTYPDASEGAHLTCGWDDPDMRDQGGDHWWHERIKEESAILRAS